MKILFKLRNHLKIRNLACVLLTLLVFKISAQQSKLDSLLRVNARYLKQDTTKLKLLNAITNEYGNVTPDKGIETGEQAIVLAQKLNPDKSVKKLLADAYYNKARNYHRKSVYPQAIELYEKALHINQTYNNKKEIADTLHDIGGIYRQTDDKRTKEYFERAMRLYEEIAYLPGIAALYDSFGDIYRTSSGYSEAMKYYKKALQLNQRLNNKKGVAENLTHIGVILELQNDYKGALEQYLKALKIAEKLSLGHRIASNLDHIAGIYRHQHEFDKAIEYYQKALTINVALGNKAEIAKNLGNMGNVYEDQSD